MDIDAILGLYADDDIGAPDDPFTRHQIGAWAEHSGMHWRMRDMSVPGGPIVRERSATITKVYLHTGKSWKAEAEFGGRRSSQMAGTLKKARAAADSMLIELIRESQLPTPPPS